jgi:GntP family gluconate:H+ symporter
MAASLATSLMAVHCLVPPHPGITAATGTMGGELGTVMLWGILLSLPAAVVGYLWTAWRGKLVVYESTELEVHEAFDKDLPPALLSFLPIILPIALIAFKSMVLLYNPSQVIETNSGVKLVSFIGEPVIALAIAILVSFSLIKKHSRGELQHWLSDGVHKAGMILAIVAAGGMFGEMLQATGTGKNLGDLLGGLSLGIFFPFLIAAVLKTAQGSSTIAVITAASLVLPLLPGLGLQSPTAVTLTILSMGAGSMIVSHANDAYFWVITRFSNLPASATLKVFTMASLLMGISVQLLIWAIWVMVR